MGKSEVLNDVLSNTFLFKGLAGIGYAVYGLRRTSTSVVQELGSAEVAERAKFLEGPAGLEAVATAAVAQLIDVRGFLATCRRSDTDSSLKQLWVFSPSIDAGELAVLDKRLGGNFVREEAGRWMKPAKDDAKARHRYGVVSRALCDAVREVLERALIRRQYLRLGSELLLPTSVSSGSLSHCFETFLCGNEPGVIGANVSIKRSDYRPLQEDEVESANDLEVVTAPNAERGRLESLKTVGAHLGESVLKRWQEAGLLFGDENSDSGEDQEGTTEESSVVYVKLDSGIHAPFPRRALLIPRRGQTRSSDEERGSTSPREQGGLAARSRGALRKRPREALVDADNNEVPKGWASTTLPKESDGFGDANDLFGFYGDSASEVDEDEESEEKEEIEGKADGSLSEAMDLVQHRRPVRLLTDWSKQGRSRSGIGSRQYSKHALLSSSAPETYIPAKIMSKFTKTNGSTTGTDSEDEDNSLVRTESTSDVTSLAATRTSAARSVKFERMLVQETAEDRSPHASSIPVDCLSTCQALFNSNNKPTDGSPVVATKTSLTAFGIGNTEPLPRNDPKRKELTDLFNLIEMQVLGRSWPEEDFPWNESSNNGKTGCPPLGTTRRALFALKSIFNTTCLSGSGDAKPGIAEGRLQFVGPLKMNEGPFEVIPLDPPRLCSGYRGDWLETSSCILPFWEKAGLEPYSCEKDIVYSAIVPSSVSSEAVSLFEDVQTSYQECALGSHRALKDNQLFVVDDDAHGTQEKHEQLLMNMYREKIAQFSMQISALHDRRKENHYVLYIVSPFPSAEREKLGLLLRALALPLEKPGAEAATTSAVEVVRPQPPRQWGAGQRPILMKVIPREALLQPAKRVDKSRWPLRAQLTKNYAFSVYAMTRRKRLTSRSEEGIGLWTRRHALPDDFWSPVTPEHVNGTPVVGKPAGSEEVAASLPSSNAATAPASTAVGSAQEPTTTAMLYEPAVVLAGVGHHLGEGNGNGEVVMHLCYQVEPLQKRCTYAWTDNRGELLDVSTIFCSSFANRSVRRGILLAMWTRGRQWWLPFVPCTRVVVAKLGRMTEDEREDWEAFVQKLLSEAGAVGEEQPEIALRFPYRSMARKVEADGADNSIFERVPREAAKASTEKLEAEDSEAEFTQTLRSVSILELYEDRVLQLLPLPTSDASQSASRPRDLVLVLPHSCSDDSEATAYVERAPRALRETDRSDGQLRLNLLSHYGERDSKSRDVEPKWDGENASDIVATVAKNYYDLCMVATAPCWPLEAWQSRWPLHAQTVRTHSELTEIALNVQLPANPSK